MTISDRKTARLVGWLFLGTFIFSIPGYLLYGPLLDHPTYVLGTGHDTQITLGALLEILTVICNIGTALALYPVARRYAHRAALGYVALRIVESTIIVAGIVSVLAVVTLRQQFAGTGALFGVYERQSSPQMLLTFPEMVWELTFGVYLIAKGFTAPARRQDAERVAVTAPAAALV
jgi:hypothetical protein